jgi:hypothetical protein
MINRKRRLTKMDEDIFSKGIGNKEGMKSLEAKPVVIKDKRIESVYPKGTTEEARPKTKPVGKKLVLICKHPDKEENISISTIVMIAGNSVKTSAMWINVDEDGLIQKGSTVSALLTKYNSPSINGLVDKTIDTVLGEDKYLAIKAY